MNLYKEQDESQNQSLTTPISNEISVYQGQLTKEAFVKETAKILQAFPKMPDATFALLKDRFKDNKFTDERLKDAINQVIDTYEGWDKIPNIANFIQYDKKIKIFTYKESIEYGQKSLIAVDLQINEPRWIRIEEQIKYKIPLWNRTKERTK
jgi:hypothetical protein